MKAGEPSLEHTIWLLLLHEVLINKFINDLLIMSAYLFLKPSSSTQTPVSDYSHEYKLLGGFANILR